MTTSVSEKPVEQTVTLREEHVTAERQPADRALSPEEAEAAFEGKTIEMVGTSEEVEVSKQARVVGEVAIGKQVNERKETVKDTVRRTTRSRRSAPKRAERFPQQLQRSPALRAGLFCVMPAQGSCVDHGSAALALRLQGSDFDSVRQGGEQARLAGRLAERPSSATPRSSLEAGTAEPLGPAASSITRWKGRVSWPRAA